MKKFKLIFLLLAVLLLTSCSFNTSKSSYDESNESSVSSNTAENENPAKGISMLQVDVKVDNDEMPDYSEDFKDKTVINFMNQEATDSDWDYKYVWNEINKYLCDNGYNFIINYIPYNYDTLPTKVYEDFLKNGQQVDLIGTGDSWIDLDGKGFDQTMFEFIKKGYLMCFDDMFKTNIGQKLYNFYPESYWQRMKYKDDKIYGKPINSMSGCSNPVAFYFNNKYVEKYNFDINSFDFYNADEIFAKIKENESITPLRTEVKFIANADESNDITDDDITADFFANWAGYMLVDNTVAIKNNKAVNMFERKDTKRLLEKLKEYKDKGYYKYYNQTDGFTDGNFFAELMGTDGVTRLGIYYDDFSYVDTDFKAATNMYWDKFYGNAGLGIATRSKNKDKAFEALYVLSTDSKISNMLKYGIEGRNYFYYDEFKNLNGVDKNIDKLYKTGKYPIINAKYPMGLEDLYNDNIVSITDIDESDNRVERKAELYKKGTYYPLSAVEIKGKNLKKKAKAVRKIYDEYADLWLGEYDDVSATLDEMNKKLYKAGLQDLLDYYNKKAG